MLIVALTLVQSAGKTLLIQEAKPRCRGQWFLPGGRLEPGESLIEAALREVREESGIEVSLQGLLHVDQLLASANSPDRLRFVFRAEPRAGSLKTSADEHSLQARWVARSELAGLPLRGPIVERAIALAESSPPLLPLSSVHLLTEQDKRLEGR